MQVYNTTIASALRLMALIMHCNFYVIFRVSIDVDLQHGQAPSHEIIFLNDDG